MAEPKHLFDVWFVRSNTVYKEVPYHAVSDWAQQAKLSADDKIRPAGTDEWHPVEKLPQFQPYLPKPEREEVADPAAALAPIELDFNWKPRHDDDDDDVDMIPLIDISLVLLIFFMMTATVASISRINVPAMEFASKIDTSVDVLRIDIDQVDGKTYYAVGQGTAAPKAEDDQLPDLATLLEHFDAARARNAFPPKVRIAAHGELPYETVNRLMNQLDQRRNKGLIDEFHIEVNERLSR